MNLECLLQGYAIEKMATNQFLQKEAARRVRGKQPISQEEAGLQDETALAMEPEQSSTWGNLLPYLLGAGALGGLGYGGYKAYQNIDKIKELLGLKTYPKQSTEYSEAEIPKEPMEPEIKQLMSKMIEKSDYPDYPQIQFDTNLPSPEEVSYVPESGRIPISPTSPTWREALLAQAHKNPMKDLFLYPGALEETSWTGDIPKMLRSLASSVPPVVQKPSVYDLLSAAKK